MNRNGIETITAETYLTTHQAAGFIQMNPSSVNKWVKEGRIECYRTPGGHRRILAGDLVSFLTEYKMPVPKMLADVLTEIAAPPAKMKPSKKTARAK